MDDLDRMYHRLVEVLRAGYPHLLERRFQLGDIAQNLIPYRHNRRELGLDGVDRYETALMRLASGERGYLLADAAVQEAFRRAAASPAPDASLLREHAGALVALAPDPARRAATPPRDAVLMGEPDGLLRVTGETARPVADPVPPARDVAVHYAAPRDPASVGAPDGAMGAPMSAAMAAEASAEPMAPADADTLARTELPLPDAPFIGMTTPPMGTRIPTPEPAPAPSRVPDPAPHSHAPSAMPTAERAGATAGRCRYCGQPLPDGRPVTFCPYCGQNLSVVQCPACSTELEVGWRFCITCGRAMDESAPAGDGGAPPPPR